MTGTERDLAAALRHELAAIDPARPCDRAAEAAGLGSRLSTRDAAVARLAVRLGHGTDARRLLRARGRPKTVRAESEREAGVGVPAAFAAPFDWDGSRDHCRIAYLRGLFLAAGSLSLAGGRTHLEFVVPATAAPILADRLAAMELPASWRIRRGRGVVTWKSAELVVTFLRRAGAGPMLLELEARQVSRAMRGDLNRVLNAESANLQRIVAAAGRQLAAIDLLDGDGRLAEQLHVVRVVAEGRRLTPEATLSELAERLDLHRSAVQRALDRIERLALHPDDERPRAARRSRPSLA
ncbi:MAG: DNA-binding protein WhiA [Chloroflexota bacterium]